MWALVNGVRLFFDVEGASLVPDGPSMREKPTVVARRGSVDPHARTPNTQVRVIENTYPSSSSGGRVISPEQFEHHGIRHPVHHLREGRSCLAAGVAFGEFKDQVLDR